MFAKIIIPVDIEHIDQARAAIAVARHSLDREGQLTLVHVVSPLPAYVAAQVGNNIFESARMEVELILNSLKTSEQLPDTTSIKVATGKAYREIIACIDDPKSQAIFMPAHRPRASDILLGSVAAQVVRHAPCSVIVLRGM
ncbi:MAG: universal stress protein [Burkholderiaceae bacterium]